MFISEVAQGLGASHVFRKKRHMAPPSLSPSDSADELLPAAPPAEVLEQMSTAGDIHRQLRRSGRELRFLRDERERLSIELHDHVAGTVTGLSAAEAVELAGGGE